MSKFKVGDKAMVASGDLRGCKVVIVNEDLDGYFQVSHGEHWFWIIKEDLLPVSTTTHFRCPVCCQYVEVIKGLLIAHNNKRVECYGSFMPVMKGEDTP